MTTANITGPRPAAPPASPLASPLASLEKVVIPVSGMTCAACQGRVQRTLSKTPGVVDASVNLMMGNATIAYDTSAISPDALVERIRETGYGAELPTMDRTAFEEQAARDAATAAEFRELRSKAWVSGIAGVLAMLLSMPLMGTMAEGHHGPVADPFMQWAMESMSIPVAAGLLFPITRLLLSPILASAAMAFSSVSVVMNSLRLRRFRTATA